jgi:anti-sigma regulatory factor (Ser/Thr protein kinase)
VGVDTGAFSHEALFYTGEDEFLAGAVPFVTEGIASGEPILVVVSARRCAVLRETLGADGDRVEYADMAAVGVNPARIIPTWQRFVQDRADRGQPARGIGEPIFPSRRPAELVECQQHEALLNHAFAAPVAFRLLCPYDTRELDDRVIAEARRAHPLLQTVGSRPEPSAEFAYADAGALPRVPLPEPDAAAAAGADSLTFDAACIESVRRLTERRAWAAGLSADRVLDVTLAVHELATNSVRHGGGGGRLRVWSEPDEVVFEVADRGLVRDPLAGRRVPEPGTEGGRGLWLANQLCDLVQIRSGPDGTVVRILMGLPR